MVLKKRKLSDIPKIQVGVEATARLRPTFKLTRDQAYDAEDPSVPLTVKQIISDAYVFEEAEQDVTIHSVSVMRPFTCEMGEGCKNRVQFKVNDIKSCQTHMVDEVKKGNKPEILPSDEAERIPLEMDKPVPEHLLPPAPEE